MSLIMKLSHILEEGLREYTQWDRAFFSDFTAQEQIGAGGGNRLAWGDNIQYMKYLLADGNMQGKLDCIYMDPPFFSKADYGSSLLIPKTKTKSEIRLKQKAYNDTWENGMEEYLEMIAARLFFMRELLADTGCLWVHLDWHAVHYVKILLDEIFGEENFLNEVIWNYKSGGVSKKRFARKHDTLLFYSKTKNYFFTPQKEKSYNRELKPYHFKNVKEYKDEIGWHTLVNMKDVWQIDMVGRTSAERTGYATQKPEALIQRILQSCTEEGALCADFFSGSGTLASAAHKMNRRWIACDKGAPAVANTHKRLMRLGADYELLKEVSLPENRVQQQCGKLHIKIEIEKASRDSNAAKQPLKLFLQIINYELAESDYEEPLMLIDCWSIDTDYDGRVFHAEQNFLREKGCMKYSYESVKERFQCIAVRSIDIFGNQTLTAFSAQDFLVHVD